MDYQSNSDKSKEEKGDKQISKVVTGEVIRKPESFGRKFRNVFFGGDVKTAGRFVAADVILPAVRDLLVDAIVNGAKGVIYGDSTFRRRTAENRSIIRYDNPDRRAFREPRETIVSGLTNTRRGLLPDQPAFRQRERSEHQDLILSRRQDAEVVVERLIDIIDKFEVASLADLYDLVGLRSTAVDNKWGWTSLNNVEIRQIRDGYFIDLPPVEPI